MVCNIASKNILPLNTNPKYNPTSFCIKGNALLSTIAEEVGHVHVHNACFQKTSHEPWATYNTKISIVGVEWVRVDHVFG